MLNKKIPGFTLAELLVTLALTGLLAGFSYMGLNYIQRLLKQYSNQSDFVTEITELNKRLSQLSNSNATLLQVSDAVFECKSNTESCNLELKDDFVLVKRFEKIDTFHFEIKNLKVIHEPLGFGLQSSLVKQVDFDAYFEKQKFHLTLSKNYDAVTKLALLKEMKR